MTWACCLAPKTLKNYDPLLQAVERQARVDPAAWRLNRAVVLFRMGQPGESIVHLRAGLDPKGPNGPEWDWLILALAYQQKGQIPDAKEWLEKALKRYDKYASQNSISWAIQLQFQLLRQEAERDIGQSGK